MSRTILFDTLAYVKTLEASGVNPKQAEAQAECLINIFEDQIATKKDIDDLAKDMEIRFSKVASDIKILEKDIDVKFSEARADTKAVDIKITWLLVLIPILGLALTISNYLHH